MTCSWRFSPYFSEKQSAQGNATSPDIQGGGISMRGEIDVAFALVGYIQFAPYFK
jgi:hypothetical protein